MKQESTALPEYLRFWLEQNIGTTPVWDFPHLNDSKHLSYHRLHFHNRQHVLDIFKADTNPYVEKDFKETKALYEYVANLWIVAPYSLKKGGIDWLIQSKKGAWVGLLHAYDLSKEQISFRHRSCTIGFLVGEQYRGTGIAQEAVQHLQQYLFTKMNMLYLLAYTKDKNQRSQRFLKKLGYEDVTLRYAGGGKSYFHLYRSKRAKSMVRKVVG